MKEHINTAALLNDFSLFREFKDLITNLAVSLPNNY